MHAVLCIRQEMSANSIPARPCKTMCGISYVQNLVLLHFFCQWTSKATSVHQSEPLGFSKFFGSLINRSIIAFCVDFLLTELHCPFFCQTTYSAVQGVGNCFKNITKSSQYSSHLNFFDMKFGVLTQKHIPQLLSVGFLETWDNGLCY